MRSVDDSLLHDIGHATGLHEPCQCDVLSLAQMEGMRRLSDTV